MTNVYRTSSIHFGDPLPITRVWASHLWQGSTENAELIYESTSDLSNTLTRWVFDHEDSYLSYVFEMSGTYPIAGLTWLDEKQEKSSIRHDQVVHRAKFHISTSLDRHDWQSFEDMKQKYVLARYIHVRVLEDSLSHVSSKDQSNFSSFANLALYMIAGKGFACEYEARWTACFARNTGWTGSDGIYTISSSGEDVQGSQKQTKTLFIFGDTFIGGVDEKTRARISPAMINNSFAMLDGRTPDPDKLLFLWNDRDPAKPESAIVPLTPSALAIPDTYYWLQDGVNIGGHVYMFPIIIGPDPDGPDGFQFAVHGIVRVRVPWIDGNLQFGKQQQIDTPLLFKNHRGFLTYFGAALFPNTQEASAPHPDGYIYIYGIQQTGTTDLAVARVPVEQFEDFASWTYWDGTAWNQESHRAEPVAKNISCELSITPMIGGTYDGKYVISYLEGGITPKPYVCLLIGDSPVGPFTEHVKLYYCDEHEEGRGIYAYNGKAHPHLSEPGELLISYNVNTTSWDAHHEDGTIYRPRFIRVYEIQ